MGTRARRKQSWYTQTLTPLMEGPMDPEMQEEGNKKERSWEVIREWFRAQKGSSLSSSPTSFSMSNYFYGNGSIPPARKHDLRLLLGVLGCPLAPIPLLNHPIHHIRLKDIPIVSFIYIILPCCTLSYMCFDGVGNIDGALHNTAIFGGIEMLETVAEMWGEKHVCNRECEDDML